MKKILLFSIICLIALASFAFAADEDIVIEDIEAYINDDFQGDIDEEGGNFEIVHVGDNISITVNVENTFESDDLEDVYVKIDIDDFRGRNDDLTKSSDKEDEIRDGDDQEFTIEFTIPSDVAEGDLDIRVTAYGKVDGDKISASETLDMVVKKPAHSIKITELKLDKTLAACGSEVTVTTTMKNDGSSEEVGTLTVEGLDDIKTSSFKVASGFTLTRNAVFEVPSDLASGDHLIKALVSYSGNTETSEELITVRGCSGTTTSGSSNSGSTPTGSSVSDKPVITGDPETRFSVKQKETGFNSLVIILLILIVVMFGTTMFAIFAGRN